MASKLPVADWPGDLGFSQKYHTREFGESDHWTVLVKEREGGTFRHGVGDCSKEGQSQDCWA